MTYRLKVKLDDRCTVYPAWLYNEMRKRNIEYTADAGFLVFQCESDFKTVSALFSSRDDKQIIEAEKPLRTAKNAQFQQSKKKRKLF